jgi:Yip1-like protein
MDLMLRIIRIVVSPRDEWQRIAGERWHAALRYVLLLSLLPAFASFVNLRNSELPLPPHAVGFTYFAAALGVLMLAIAFWLLGRMFSPEATLARCVQVAAFGTTPLFVASALLVMPVLVIVCVVSLLHVFYLYYLGAQQLLGVPESDAAQFVAIALVLAIVASTLGGGAVGALGLL